MAKPDRSEARARVISAAQAAGRELSAQGVDFAPLDVIKIAAGFAADHIVQTCEFGTDAAQRSIADTLRREFLAQIRHYEELHFGGGERD